MTGRGIGIIDTIQLMEVVQGISVMERSGAADKEILAAVKAWFEKYLAWLTTHQYGKDEMNAREQPRYMLGDAGSILSRGLPATRRSWSFAGSGIKISCCPTRWLLTEASRAS